MKARLPRRRISRDRIGITCWCSIERATSSPRRSRVCSSSALGSRGAFPLVNHARTKSRLNTLLGCVAPGLSISGPRRQRRRFRRASCGRSHSRRRLTRRRLTSTRAAVPLRPRSPAAESCNTLQLDAALSAFLHLAAAVTFSAIFFQVRVVGSPASSISVHLVRPALGRGAALEDGLLGQVNLPAHIADPRPRASPLR